MIFRGLVLLAWIFFCTFSAPLQSRAAEPVSLRIWPPHAGVFARVGKQQFTAIATFADGSEADYTDKVAWSLEPYPFANQKLTPDQVATIDKNGLVTIKSTWGRVKVVATYPAPAWYRNSFAPPAICLLLRPKEDLDYLGALPAVYALLLSSPNRVVARITGVAVSTDRVLVTGTNLGNGGDILRVTIGGQDAEIVSQSPSMVYVRADVIRLPATGRVEVFSTSQGMTAKKEVLRPYRMISLPEADSVASLVLPGPIRDKANNDTPRYIERRRSSVWPFLL